MVLMSILSVILFGLLVAMTSIQPLMSTMSLFELERRQKVGDKGAIGVLRRNHLLPDILSLQRVSSALLLVLFVIMSVASFGAIFGTIVAVVVALEYGAIARWSTIHKYSQVFYEKYEVSLLAFVEQFASFFRLIRTSPPKYLQAKQLDSREELLHMIMQSGALLSSDEKKRIERSLTFDERLVSEVMTPRGVIDSVNKNDLLGPLVLDDLHKTGHSRFPVIDGDMDHIVGILFIQTIFALDSKKTTTVEKAMEPRVFYIREDHTLQSALAAFLRTHHHLFVVVNEFRETVGLLSLEDIIEELLGHEIVDEFDRHEDLRAVAMHNPRANNHPKNHEDV